MTPENRVTDVFKQLAQTLDQMPEGFPVTESGVEIKILKKIYSTEDARMFLKLKRQPETAQEKYHGKRNGGRHRKTSACSRSESAGGGTKVGGQTT